MKKIIWLALLAAIFMLSACGEEKADTTGAGMNLEPVETKFNSPDTSEPGEIITLSVTVTQGTETVEDADEVVYEIWKSGHRKESEMLTTEHKGDGVYEAEMIFEDEGLYIVQAHTTASRLHIMPKQEITVGNPDPESIVPDDSTDSEGMNKKDSHSH